MGTNLFKILIIILLLASPAYANETLKFEQRSFIGGLNTETNANLIDNSETPDCLNVVPYENIGISTRLGYRPYINCKVGDLKESFDVITGWSGSTDAASVAVSTTNYREGIGSIEFDKTGTTEAFASISKTVSLNLSSDISGDGFGYGGGYDDGYGLKYVLAYINTAYYADVASVVIILETDDWNYSTWTVTDFNAGWNKLTLDSDDADVTGTMNWGSITKIVCKVNTNNTSDTFADMAFDCLVCCPDTDYVIRGLHKYIKSQGESYILCAANTNIYKSNEALGMWIPIYTTLSANQNVNMIDINGLCFITNGVNSNLKFDGTSVTKMGIISPSAAPTLNAVTSGNLYTGSYSWVYTYYNSSTGHESNPSTTYSKNLSIGQGVTLNVSQSADSQVDKIRLYRTVVNGSLFLFEKEVATASTVTSNIEDALLGLPVDTTNAAPPVLKHIVYHKNRLCGWGNPNNLSYIYFSNVDEPESFDDEDARDISSRDGYLISGMTTSLNDIIITKERNNIYVASSSTFNDISEVVISKANTDRGCISNRSIAQLKNFIMFLSDRNTVEAYIGADAETVDKYALLQTVDTSEKITRTLKDISSSTTCAVVYDDCYILSAPTKNTVLYYDSSLKSWWKLNGMRIYQFLIDGTILYGAFNDGMVHRLFTGITDNGSAITAYWKSKQYDLNLPNNWKRLRRLYLNFEGETRGDVNLSYFTDHSLADTTKAIELASTTTQWGSFDWGGSSWAGVPASVQGRVIMNGRCKVFQIMLKNEDLNEQFKLFSLELFYIPKGYYDW